MPRPPLIVIAGPTASGKSALAIRLAQLLTGEILNGDSVQAIRGADIGSAKPTAAERQLVPHHHFDCRDPSERWDAGSFSREVGASITTLTARGVFPILVAPAGMYVTALLHGLADLPAAHPEVRARLEQVESEALWQRLIQVDPLSAARIHRNDRIRMIRALETFEVTGHPLGETHQSHRLQEVRFPALIYVVVWNRAELAERILERSRQMVQSGLLAEAKALLTAYGPAAPLFESIGYREALQVLTGEMGVSELAPKTAQATQQFAKRQLTYWRNEPHKRGWEVRPRADDPQGTLYAADLRPGASARMTRSVRGIHAFSWGVEELRSDIEARAAERRERPLVTFVSGRAVQGA